MNLPEEFEKRMKQQLGDEFEAFAKAFTEGGEAKGLRFSLSRLPEGKTPEEILAEMGQDGNEKIPWAEGGYYYNDREFIEDESFEDKSSKEDSLPNADTTENHKSTYRSFVRPGKSIYHEAGAFYIQEPSAMVVAKLANVKPGEKVLDLCAAPGGKSTALGDMLRGEGILVSNEIHPSRAKILSENIERMGISNALVLNETPEKISSLFPEFFDCVVVDAPCSGEGMFRKEEAALREWSLENVEMCAARQKDILREAVKCVAPGGRLIYSTCTFAPAEDEENIAWFLSEYPEFHLAIIPDGMDDMVSHARAEQSRWSDKDSVIRIWPHKQKGEGHFAAVLLRQTNDEVPETQNEERIEKKNKNDKKVRGKNIALSREMRESFEIFAKETLTKKGRNCFEEVLTYSPKDEKIAVLFGENLYLEPFYFPGKGVRIERAGLHLGTFAKNRFEPSLALARVLGADDVCSIYEITKDRQDEAYAYLAGEQLYHIPPECKGWTLVTYEGYSLGFGKASNGVLKNHYPKGLRMDYNNNKNNI